MKNSTHIINTIIEKYRGNLHPVFSWDLNNSNCVAIDLSNNNSDISEVDIASTAALSDFIFSKLRIANKRCGIGGYNEDRVVYRRSEHFGTGDNCRSIHLGIDIWCQSGTVIRTPLPATIHSFRVNDNFGDYGPTIILEHQLDGVRFYSLYGHLSVSSLLGKSIGMRFDAGQIVASTGEPHENGNWPPHLHFQLIADMQNYHGDYPGVCSLSERDYFLQLCPDPSVILQIE